MMFKLNGTRHCNRQGDLGICFIPRHWSASAAGTAATATATYHNKGQAGKTKAPIGLSDHEWGRGVVNMGRRLADLTLINWSKIIITACYWGRCCLCLFSFSLTVLQFNRIFFVCLFIFTAATSTETSAIRIQVDKINGAFPLEVLLIDFRQALLLLPFITKMCKQLGNTFFIFRRAAKNKSLNCITYRPATSAIYQIQMKGARPETNRERERREADKEGEREGERNKLQE